jgi:hypothetical protein
MLLWTSAMLLNYWGAPALSDDRELKDEDGLLYEAAVSKTQDTEFFNKDNTIYKPGREFVYAYSITKDGEALICRTNAVGDFETRNWTLVPPAERDSLAIMRLGFKVLPGHGGLDELFPDYSQTVVQQQYWAADMSLLFDGLTGLIENDANVWLHPFRGKYFSVTQLSPFPFVKFPLKAGQAWKWKLGDIDSRWSDTRIIEYEGKVSATYDYRVIGQKSFKSPLGDLETWEIEGTATSRLGTSSLRSYFNERYGFVRLEYRNLDRSEIVLDLTEVRGP